MQADIHHFRRALCALAVQHVKTILQILEEMIARIEPLRRCKPHIVSIQRVGNNQMRPLRTFHPIGQIIGIGVGRVEKPALLHDQGLRVHRTPARIPAERAFSRQFGMQADGFGNLAALLLDGHILVLDPFQPMRGDFPIGLLHRLQLIRTARHGGRHAIHGHRHVALGEHPPEPPEPGTGAIFVNRFHVPVALTRPLCRADDFGQEGL